MARYRKRPVVIEAAQLPARAPFDAEAVVRLQAISAWCGGAIHKTGLLIATMEGRMNASPGDWIIKGVKGEFYPCKPEIFEATYEAVEP
ncbi:MAG: hypothetical protein ABIP42_09535 [Planctomycetota bacterium]